MNDEINNWRDACRLLLELDEQGYKEPWREFEWSIPGSSWVTCDTLERLWQAMQRLEQGFRLRLKPRTVRVTTHNGEVLELPEPWWDATDGVTCYYVDPTNYVKQMTLSSSVSHSREMRASGNIFRTREDAEAWADAMPRIKGGKSHD